MSIVQELGMDDVREDIRTILHLLPADKLHRLEEMKLSYIVQDLITDEVRRRTEVANNPNSQLNQLRRSMGL